MKKVQIFNRATFKQEITNKDNPYRLVLNNVSADATIDVSIERDAETKRKFITTLSVPFLLEAQNKIERLEGGFLRTYRYQKSDVDPNNGSNWKKTIKSAHIEVAKGGEILLNDKDTVEVNLQNLDTVSNTSMVILGGVATSNQLYKISKTLFERGESEEKIDVTKNSYLLFREDALPDSIEYMYGSEKITVDKNYIMNEQEDVFGVVAYNEDNTPIFGSDKVVVISLNGVTSCYLKMEEDLTKDLVYYTI